MAELLDRKENACYVHSVNMCEVFYEILRTSGEGAAQKAVTDLLTAGARLRDDLDPPFWQAVGRLKSRGRVSLADCFCIPLAQRLEAEVLTTDHHEFDRLISLGVCPIRFIR